MIGAKKSIYWYRNGQEVEKELQAIKRFLDDNFEQSFTEKCRKLKTPAVKGVTIQSIVLSTFLCICGADSVLLYMETVLKRAEFTLFKSATLVIIVNFFSVSASIISAILIDKCGRKLLMVISCIGVCLSALMLAAHFLLLRLHEDVSDLQWFFMIGMISYRTTYYLGLTCVPRTILSKSFSASIKSAAARRS